MEYLHNVGRVSFFTQRYLTILHQNFSNLLKLLVVVFVTFSFQNHFRKKKITTERLDLFMLVLVFLRFFIAHIQGQHTAKMCCIVSISLIEVSSYNFQAINPHCKQIIKLQIYNNALQTWKSARGKIIDFQKINKDFKPYAPVPLQRFSHIPNT